jgi:UDP-3-O-[3-hydroxymyristoyl] glucosamine N-acyltransferase
VVSQVGISGSVTVGDGVVLGGQVGVADHVSIGAGAKLAARSGVTNDLAGGATYGGMPAQEAGRWRREIAMIRKLTRDSKGGAKP